MAPFAYSRSINHPYAESSPRSHGHFLPTPFPHPSFSAPAVPFLWVRKENMEDFAKLHGIDVDPKREPDLGFETGWVQDLDNQRGLLDCFFGHIRPEESLCFFYAKKVPFTEKAGRILVGVGRVSGIGKGVEYRMSRSAPLKSMVWERIVQHSIREDRANGFLMPYAEALAYAKENPDFNLDEIAAVTPEDRQLEFSYASEHVSHDAAISSLLACEQSLRKLQKVLPGKWTGPLKWIDARIGEIWKLRGPCPGLIAALSAFGIAHPAFVAREILSGLKDNDDPWPRVDAALRSPDTELSPACASGIGKTVREAWNRLRPQRQQLLKLISRFELTAEQATVLYVEEERRKAGIELTDAAIIANPYLIFEGTRLQPDGVSIWTVDRGVFPEAIILEKHPLPAPTALDSGLDSRRIRALSIHTLEKAANEGHTLRSRAEVVLHIREMPLSPECEVTGDTMEVAEKSFQGEISEAMMSDGSRALQLTRLQTIGELIADKVEQRVSGKRHTIPNDWESRLNDVLGSDTSEPEEKRSRLEKTASLQELAESRFSVLIGPAGTGKTTLISVLCGHPSVSVGGVLLLAPTGKARVRIQELTRDLGLKAQTLAQFLTETGRYDGSTGRYQLATEKADVGAKTVIVDEASMLTEEMLGALLDSLSGVTRLILIGDPRQLPPIGAGRPFVDIISKLAPANAAAIFPRVGRGYAELTVRRRQQGKEREDLQLADWFSGAPLFPGEDDVFDVIVKPGRSAHVEFKEWTSPTDLRTKVIETVVNELGLKDAKDIKGFELMLGGVESNGYVYFNRGNAAAAEAWQILSPVRNAAHGVAELNRYVHEAFRTERLELARMTPFRKVPAPAGDEQIVYGDKVINVVNHRHYRVYPKEDAPQYIANGEMGMVVGQWKRPSFKGNPWKLEVNFSSQIGFSYDFGLNEFGEEGNAKLELAYALTVHKAQGSQFGTVIVVLPNPCWLLSRELLYTALTRQQNRVVILHQGNRFELKKYASQLYSETAARLTNLFCPPNPIEVKGRFLEERLISRTQRGELVRSKSEVIIADKLASRGVDYTYELALTLGGATRFPDFTIQNDESGVTYYWEHCGMLHVGEYAKRWGKKLKWYRENDILPWQEGGGPNGTLIETRDNEKGGIDSAEIEEVMKRSGVSAR